MTRFSVSNHRLTFLILPTLFWPFDFRRLVYPLPSSAILFLKYKSVKSGEAMARGGKGNTISDEELYVVI